MLHPTASTPNTTISVTVTSVSMTLKFNASRATNSEVIAADAIDKTRKTHAMMMIHP
jgi:hypothetical protein